MTLDHGTTTADERRLLAQAKQQYEAGDFEQAALSYEKAIEIGPGNAMTYVSRGQALVGAKQFEAAMADFQRAVELDPKNGRCFAERGNNHYRLGDKKLAVEDWDRALCLDEYNLDLRMTRASVLIELGELQQAQAEVAATLSADPRHAGAYNLRGIVFQRLNKNQIALESFDEAIKFNQGNSIYYTNRGSLLLALNQFTKAAADLEKARELHPRNAVAHNLLAVCYLQANDLHRALNMAGTAVKLQNSATNRANLAIVHFALGNVEEARREFESTLEGEQINDSLLCARAQFWLELNELPYALNDCQQLVERNKNNSQAHELLGLYYLKSADLAKALESFDRSLVLRHDRRNARFHRAQLLGEMNNEHKALSELDWLLQRDKDDIDCLRLRAEIHLQLNNPEAAEQDFQSVLNIKGTDAAAQIGLFRCKADSGDLTGALDAASELARNFQTADLLAERADIFYQLDRKDEALNDIKESLTRNSQQAKAWGVLGCLQTEQALYEEAIKHFDKALANSNITMARMYLPMRGFAKALQGLALEAEADWKAAEEVGADLSYLLSLRAQVWERQGEIDKAISCYKQAQQFVCTQTAHRIRRALTANDHSQPDNSIPAQKQAEEQATQRLADEAAFHSVEEERLSELQLAEERESEQRHTDEQEDSVQRFASEQEAAHRLAEERANVLFNAQEHASMRLAEESSVPFAEQEAALHQHAEEQAAAQRHAEERAAAERHAEEHAEAERLAEEHAAAERLAEEHAEAERLAEEQAAAQRHAEDQAEAQRRAEEQATAQRHAAEQATAQRHAAEQAAQQRQVKETFDFSPVHPTMDFAPTPTAYAPPPQAAEHNPTTKAAPTSNPAPAPAAAPPKAPPIGDPELRRLCQAIVANPSEPDGFFDRGKWHYDRGEFDAALADFDDAADIAKPESATYSKALMYRAIIRYSDKQFHDAHRDLAALLKHNPGYLPGLHYMGLVRRELGFHKQADAELNRTAATYQIAADEATALINTHRHSDAEALLSELLLISPKSARLFANRAFCNYRLKEYGQSLNDYANAIRFDSYNPEHYSGRGWCYVDQKRFNDAIADWKQALKLNADDHKVRTSLANLLLSCERPEEALCEVDLAIESAPTYADAHRIRALILQDLGQFKEAIEAHNAALKHGGEDKSELVKRGTAHLMMLDLDQAKDDAERALQLDPAFPGGYELLADYHVAKEDRATAMQVICESIKKNPHAASSLALRAEIWARMHEPLAAIADCHAVLEAAETNAPLVLKELALYNLHNGDYESALEHASNLLNVFHQSAGLAVRALVYEHLNRLAEADADLQEALKVKPKSELAWAVKGRILSRQARFDDAIDCFNKAISHARPALVDTHYPAVLLTCYTERGFAKASAGNESDAYKDWEQALHLGADEALVCLRQANVAVNNGDIEKAFERLKEAEQRIGKATSYKTQSEIRKGLIELRSSVIASASNHEQN